MQQLKNTLDAQQAAMQQVERPILYSTEMVKAILNDCKNKTRRTKGLEEINKNPDDWQFELADFALKNSYRFTQKSTINKQSLKDRSFKQVGIKCPYGKIGDVLWVRESFCVTQPFDPETYYFGYKCGIQPHSFKPASEKYDYSTPDIWKPSIHMPKEAARIWLKITKVRVERLWNITEEDAKAEGVEILGFYPGYKITNRGKFEGLWNLIHGNGSWDENPWVWVIEFEIISKTGR